MYPKISVIVPVYNTNKYLKRCIDSILAQSFINFELLLVDDGSTDGSEIICDEYIKKDPRVRTFHKINAGVSSARNLGLENVRGEWVTFVDSDDWVEENYLSSFYLKNEVMYVFSIRLYENSGISYKSTNDIYGKKQEVIPILKDCDLLGYLVNKIFNYAIIKKNNIKFNETIKFREDEDFVLQYLNYIDQINFINKATYNYWQPNLNVKYNNTDNFNVSLSLYNSIYGIYGQLNPIVRRYLLELVNVLFDSFVKIKADRQKRVKLFKDSVGWNILFVKDLSIITRISFFLPSYLLSLLFDFKVKYKKYR